MSRRRPGPARTSRGRLLGALAATVAVALLAAGCSSGSGSTGAAGSTTAGASADLTGSLDVFAAASLKGAFDELAQRFGAAHPGVTVKPVDYDGSSTLATQLTGGAKADVFAAADTTTMQTVVDAGLTQGDPTVFTTNSLQIAVAPGNPKNVHSLADLATLSTDGGKVVICAPEVPCGNATTTALDAAGVTLQPASQEQNVTAVLTKVVAGEADAGLVYRTDVQSAAGKVDGVDFPEAAQAINHYPIAELAAGTRSGDDATAAAFVRYVLGPDGQAVLKERGFVAP
ncbi:molybdate ABC transporter substrate-binding protein [Cellulomonas alba]|uniref:Molybdate ABC transporter substrate-binding protein n=1 Tax=Cellulomonas alba TaxID=3053467 RepID=A0ABT7SD36_9CELL|nr:molybdate ABC transporter substrate-binding protein [Cellulomonas alba]MDM7854097.1 molybdate ABC transporter substrate-binding protein [Cellulomonas alba]